MNLDKYKHEDATHLLKCKHCVGTGRCKNYTMPAIKLKTMDDGRIKLVVFGERDWKGKENVKKIRYVVSSRVSRK